MPPIDELSQKQSEVVFAEESTDWLIENVVAAQRENVMDSVVQSSRDPFGKRIQQTTGFVLRDYMKNLFPIVELVTSDVMRLSATLRMAPHERAAPDCLKDCFNVLLLISTCYFQ